MKLNAEEVNRIVIEIANARQIIKSQDKKLERYQEMENRARRILWLAENHPRYGRARGEAAREILGELLIHENG